MLNEFGKKLQGIAQEFYYKVRQSRSGLSRVDFTNSFNIISSIVELRKCEQQLGEQGSQIEKLISGEKLLINQNYRFPQKYLNIDIISSEFERYKWIYQHQQAKYKEQYSSIKKILLVEEGSITDKIHKIEKVWQKEKPYEGSRGPEEALATIGRVRGMIDDNFEQMLKLNEAKELLGLKPVDLGQIEAIRDESLRLDEL